MDIPFDIVALVIAVFVFAGLVKGFIGAGLPSIALGALAIALPPAQAAALIVFPTLLTNIWQMLVGPYFLGLLRRLWSLLIGSVIGVFLTGGIITSANQRTAALGLGLALVVYSVIGLTGWHFSVSRRAERWLSFPVGIATGMVTGATGVNVLPAGPYFHAIGLDKDELVQTLGLSFTVSTAALGFVLWWDGVLQVGNAGGSLLAVLPALIGMAIGQRLRSLASPEVFRKCFFAGLLALGAIQAIRNLI